MKFGILLFVATLSLMAALPICATGNQAPQGGRVVPAAKDPQTAIRTVLDTMNRAITEKDLPLLLGTFAEGSVKVDLFPAHQFGPAEVKQEQPKVVDLHQRWETVAAILFTTPQNYSRHVRGLSVHVDGELAVAWLDIETESSAATGSSVVKRNRFKEICILRRQENGWKIVALTNNRQDIR